MEAYGTLKPGLHPGCHALGWGTLFPSTDLKLVPMCGTTQCPATALVGSQPTWSEKGENFEKVETPKLYLKIRLVGAK